MIDVLATVLTTFDTSAEEDEKQRAALEQSIALVLRHVDLAGLQILAVHPLLATDYDVFESSVLSHLTPLTVETPVSELDSSDVNGEAVIHDLRSRGWTIYPPR